MNNFTLVKRYQCKRSIDVTNLHLTLPVQDSTPIPDAEVLRIVVEALGLDMNNQAESSTDF